MKNAHADNMRLYADDAQKTRTPWLLWEHRPAGCNWGVQCRKNSKMWLDGHEYRRIDPYRELREAVRRGEVIQSGSCVTGEWVDLPKYGLIWDKLELGEDPDCFGGPSPWSYRIKPKTVKKWRWISSTIQGLIITIDHYTMDEGFQHGYLQHIDSTMIEVEA